MGNPGTLYPPNQQPQGGGVPKSISCGGSPGPCPPPPKVTDMKLDNSGCLGTSGRCAPINVKLDMKGCGGGPGPCPPTPRGCSGGPCPTTPAAGTAVTPTNSTMASPDTTPAKEAPGFYKAPLDSGQKGATPVQKLKV